MAGLAAPAAVPLEIPAVVDPRIEVSLYADSDQIVTPIGAAVDAKGRLFVLESHTHQAPRNYPGPKRDLIKVFEGAGPDGRAARVGVFADGLLEGMNLAFSPAGTLYVVTSKAVLALPDRDRDGRADGAEELLRLETSEKYPHNQLLGITISPDGWVYVARGNTGGHPHAWVAADGRRLEAYGNGGDIVRVRLDGSGLERFAEGLWNPFDLKFDRQGRLLCADNDPDSRGPNRLLHVVAGGDYGFKSRYGASGLHPYNSWNGELPGTLPMIAGIGESPSGLLDLAHGALPAGCRDAIAVTIWGEQRVSLVRTHPSGTSLRGTVETFIQGGRWFRPVAIVAAPDGTIYLTDWMLKDYPNHGYGRIWRLGTREGVPTVPPRATWAEFDSDPGRARLDGLAHAPAADLPALRAALGEDDPFVRHAAVMGLTAADRRAETIRLLEADEPAVHRGALLALRHTGTEHDTEILAQALDDPDEGVRAVALVWTGERELRSLLPAVDAVGRRTDLTAPAFELWLATMQILRTPPAADGKRRHGFAIKRSLDPALLEGVATNEARPGPIRAFALRRLLAGNALARLPWLLELVEAGDALLRIEAVRGLTDSGDPQARAMLRKIATDAAEPPELRTEAIVALGAGAAEVLQPLLRDWEPEVRRQAARTLRVPVPGGPPPVSAPPPDDVAGWLALLATGGDPAAGRRVFFAPTSTCSLCHTAEARGGSIGPDLSLVGRALRREQIVRSIVVPSESISPEYQGWEVRLTNGDSFTGLQGHLTSSGGATMLLLDGREIKWRADELAAFGAMERSLMPEGLAALFTVEEMRDLVAYLEQLR